MPAIEIPIEDNIKLCVHPLAACEEDIQDVTGEDIDIFKYLFKSLAKFVVKEDLPGIALPQVGINIRLCVVRNVWDKLPVSSVAKLQKKTILMANPTYGPTVVNLPTVMCKETCLCCSSDTFYVRRHKHCTLRYTDAETGETGTKYMGPLELGVQHIIDHTNGWFLKNIATRKTT